MVHDMRNFEADPAVWYAPEILRISSQVGRTRKDPFLVPSPMSVYETCVRTLAQHEPPRELRMRTLISGTKMRLHFQGLSYV